VTLVGIDHFAARSALAGYPRETVVAEKVQALCRRDDGIAMKRAVALGLAQRKPCSRRSRRSARGGILLGAPPLPRRLSLG